MLWSHVPPVLKVYAGPLMMVQQSCWSGGLVVYLEMLTKRLPKSTVDLVYITQELFMSCLAA